jgi:hypothetical protein
MESAAKAKHICNNIITNIYYDYKNKQHRNATEQEALANIDDLVEIELLLTRIFERQNTPEDKHATIVDNARIEVLIGYLVGRRDATFM